MASTRSSRRKSKNTQKEDNSRSMAVFVKMPFSSNWVSLESSGVGGSSSGAVGGDLGSTGVDDE